ncbi:MAG: histidine phosphatase family protein, partial [Selenomonas sp.]|nr:histidine phosphatase family protein [Selenomonas sp.]
MKNVLLVRHGESAANAGLPTVTPEDIPLTEIGREQAEAVAKSIPFCPDMIISSPFLRARQTAEPAVERFIGSRFGLWPKVREFTYLSPASCIGTTVADRKDRVEAYWNAADPDYVDGEGAESFRQFMLRVDEVIKKLNDLS